MPDPDPVRPAGLQVALAQDRAKSQDPVIAVEIEPTDGTWSAHRTMMGVVEEKGVAAAACPMPTNGAHEPGCVPFVDEDEIGACQQEVEIGRVSIERAGEIRIGAAPGGEPRRAGRRLQVRPAPARPRLEGMDLVAAGGQLAGDAAQEMGVAVVPAGGQRMAEEDDPHAMALCWEWAASSLP
jgi:hypothetical protein